MSHVWPGGDCMRETLVLGGLVLESTCPGGGANARTLLLYCMCLAKTLHVFVSCKESVFICEHVS